MKSHTSLPSDERARHFASSNLALVDALNICPLTKRSRRCGHRTRNIVFRYLRVVGSIRACAMRFPATAIGGTGLSLKDNRVLASLSGADLKRLAPNLKEIELERERTLFEPNDRITHAYFPWEGAVCLLAIDQDGTSTQVATIGSEGV